jgi:hypothetical protein
MIELPYFKQPSPAILEGGDCAYCCIASAFNLPSVLAAYELVERVVEENDPEERFIHERQHSYIHRMKFFLKCMKHSSRELRPPHFYYRPGCVPVPWDNINWIKQVRQQIELGHPCFSSILLNGRAPTCRQDPGWMTDHMVLITGYRKHTIPYNDRAGALINEEIQIQCSSKGKYWIEWSDYLFWHIGYPTIPKREKLSADLSD